MSTTKSQLGWKETTLGEVAEILSGGTPSTKESAYWDGNIPWITPKDLSGFQGMFIDRGERNITEDGCNNSSAKKLQKNTILFSSRAPIGYVAIANNEVTTNQGFKNVFCDEKNSHFKFIYYWLIDKTELIKKLSSGSTFSEASGGLMKSLPILIPSINEQRAIAALLSSLDDKIELLRTQNKTLEAIAQQLFHEWFVEFNFPNADGKPYKKSGGKMVDGELGKMPEGWRVGRFTDFVDVLSGGTPKTGEKKYWNGSIPFFTPKDAKSEFYVLQTEKMITEEGLENCNSKLYPENTIFITARGTIGKCALSGIPMAMNQSCYALAGKDIGSSLVFLLTVALVSNLQKSASGSVFDAITVSTFESIELKMPNKILLDKFETVVTSLFQKLLANEKQVLFLVTLRDSLLPRMMSGEVRVKNVS